MTICNTHFGIVVCWNRSEQRGINGNRLSGCDAIVVSKEDSRKLDLLQYHCTSQQGAGAMYRSYELELPIRVFRSSKLRSKFAPPMKDKEKHQYRYDGLFQVKHMRCDGSPRNTAPDPKNKNANCTFHLERLPCEIGKNRLAVSALMCLVQKSRQDPANYYIE